MGVELEGRMAGRVEHQQTSYRASFFLFFLVRLLEDVLILFRQIGESTGWERWDLAHWRVAKPEGFGGKKDADEEDDDEPEEGDDVERDSAIEVKRDRSVSFLFFSLCAVDSV